MMQIISAANAGTQAVYAIQGALNQNINTGALDAVQMEMQETEVNGCFSFKGVMLDVS